MFMNSLTDASVLPLHWSRLLQDIVIVTANDRLLVVWIVASSLCWLAMETYDDIQAVRSENEVAELLFHSHLESQTEITEFLI